MAFNAAARRIALNNLRDSTDRQAAVSVATDVLLDPAVESSSRTLAALVVGHTSQLGDPARVEAHAALVTCLTELAPAHTLDVALEPVGDTFIRRTHPDDNFGSSPILEVRNGFPSRTLVAFHLDTLAAASAGASIESAVLEFATIRAWPNWNHGGIGVHRVLDAFDAARATWHCPVDTDTSNRSPDCNPLWGMTGSGLAYVESPTSVTTGPYGSTVEFDVLDDILRHSQGAPHHGWLLIKENEQASGRIELGSLESMSPPRLTVRLADPRRYSFPLNVRRACAEAVGLARLAEELSLLRDVADDPHDDAFVSFMAARSAARIAESAEVTGAVVERVVAEALGQ